MKYIIPILIVLLLVSSGFVGVSSQTFSEDVITVDDEGDGDYTSIKEAVNNANSGDTIEVYSGTYYEHSITITKDEITLKGISHELGIGNDTGKPFIDGQGKDIVIEILYGDDITITGFHIENGGGTAAHNIIGFYEADNCLISDNDLAYATCGGIYGKKSTNTWIINNTIHHSGIRSGIGFHEGENNTICGNIISDIDFSGIYIWDDHYNNITGNKISRCSNEGILIIGGHNIIKQNHIEDNTNGIGIMGNLNIVQQNNFINNGDKAYFALDIDTFPFRNWWINNYWDRPRILPYPIFGSVLVFIPWVQFDWHPAPEPYAIPSVEM